MAAGNWGGGLGADEGLCLVDQTCAHATLQSFTAFVKKPVGNGGAGGWGYPASSPEFKVCIQLTGTGGPSTRDPAVSVFGSDWNHAFSFDPERLRVLARAHVSVTRDPAHPNDVGSEDILAQGAQVGHQIFSITTDGSGNSPQVCRVFALSVPDDVNATSVYAMLVRFTVTSVTDPTAMVLVSDRSGYVTYGDTLGCTDLVGSPSCHCTGTDVNGDGIFDRNFECRARKGQVEIDALPEPHRTNLRDYNGDLCILPYGATTAALGYAGGTWTTNAYLGKFGEVFLNRNGAATQANFRSRQIKEQLTGFVDGCYNYAVGQGQNPAGVGCPDTPGVPSTWTLDYGAVPSPANTWGTCAEVAGKADNVGRVGTCTKFYDTVLKSYGSASCNYTIQQRMRMLCRDGWPIPGDAESSTGQWRPYANTWGLSATVFHPSDPGSAGSTRNGVSTAPRPLDGPPVCAPLF